MSVVRLPVRVLNQDDQTKVWRDGWHAVVWNRLVASRCWTSAASGNRAFAPWVSGNPRFGELWAAFIAAGSGVFCLEACGDQVGSDLFAFDFD